MHHEEKSITHIWTRFHKQWLAAGVISGILAGLFVLLVSGIMAQGRFGEFIQPMKLIGAAILGSKATLYEGAGSATFVGLAIHFILSGIYGFLFAQLVCEKSRPLNLVILGFVTSAIIWVFSGKLFLPSFDITLAEVFPTFSNLFLHLLFGVSFGAFLSVVRPVIVKE